MPDPITVSLQRASDNSVYIHAPPGRARHTGTEETFEWTVAPNTPVRLVAVIPLDDTIFTSYRPDPVQNKITVTVVKGNDGESAEIDYELWCLTSSGELCEAYGARPATARCRGRTAGLTRRQHPPPKVIFP
ncbi:hypothetical protein [Rubrivirga sp.]|uniref:hypothetical protein n=1 Tax=Rubrivirga sp. TaxID=1885344 RepID=UPI003B52D2BA